MKNDSILTVDLQNPTTIYVGSNGTYGGDGAIYKSIDGGVHWIAIEIGVSFTVITAIAVDPQNSAISYTGPGSAGIYKSIDGVRTGLS
jgi:hypothetical protein